MPAVIVIVDHDIIALNAANSKVGGRLHTLAHLIGHQTHLAQIDTGLCDHPLHLFAAAAVIHDHPDIAVIGLVSHALGRASEQHRAVLGAGDHSNERFLRQLCRCSRDRLILG